MNVGGCLKVFHGSSHRIMVLFRVLYVETLSNSFRLTILQGSTIHFGNMNNLVHLFDFTLLFKIEKPYSKYPSSQTPFHRTGKKFL